MCMLVLRVPRRTALFALASCGMCATTVDKLRSTVSNCSCSGHFIAQSYGTGNNPRCVSRLRPVVLNGPEQNPTSVKIPVPRGAIFRASSSMPKSKPIVTDSCGSKAIVWFQGTLRVRDNRILERAVQLAPGGLSVVVVWRHGSKIPTPTASFLAAACRSFHAELRKLGSSLTVLHARRNSDESAAEAVASHAIALGVNTILIDACEMGASTANIRSALSSAGKSSVSVEAMVDDTLFAQDVAAACLSMSRSEGSEAKVLQWSSFLKAMAQLTPLEPLAAPRRLPPLLTPAAEKLDLPPDSAWWGKPLLSGWLAISGVEISEAGARKLAEAAAARACRNGRAGFSRSHLGERAGAGDDADGKAAPRPSYLSPFLRWGILSARQADQLGVRRRDLLWRDFARLCCRLATPLRHSKPVTQVLPLEDMSAADAEALGRQHAAHGWTWTPRLVSPDSMVEDSSSAASTAASAPSWAALSGLSDAQAFEAWCTGRTGAPLVDAGMLQLWACGWMPRRVRLLCASCLVEGLGLDWRLGRCVDALRTQRPSPYWLQARLSMLRRSRSRARAGDRPPWRAPARRV